MSIGATVHQQPTSMGHRIPAIPLILLLLCAVAGALVTQHSTESAPQRRQLPASPVFARAETLIGEGKLDEAKANIEEQLRANPKSIEGYNLLGIVCASQKDYTAARNAFDKALSLDPASTKTRNNLGNLYVALGKLDLGEAEFRKVLRSDPANRDANYNLGLVLMGKDSPSGAITHFEKVRPLTIETRFNILRAYLQAHRTTEGLRYARTLSDQNKNDVQLHFTLGALLASQKEFRAAQLELEKANVLKPETFEILYNLGQTYLRSSDFANAELTLNRALKLKPDSPETMYLLAQVYNDQSRSVDALDLLMRAHKLAPQNTDIIFLLARVSMSQNFFEDAIPLLESGLKIAPERPDLHAALGESYFMSGKAQKAIEEFKRLVELDPSARSYAFLGLSYRHLGRFDEARKYFQEGLKKDPKNASCLFNMGYIEERQGNKANADQLFQATLRANPDFSEALFELANLRIQGKQFEQAAELLRRYIKVSRDPAQGYYKLAMVERSLHKLDAAQRDLGVFQTLSRDSSTGPYPYQHLFDYLDNRSKLSPEARTQLDLAELTEQARKHPDQPQNLYLLAETYLKLGNLDEAKSTINRLDQISADYRTQTGIGVLLARYRLYDDAISHFQAAAKANPDSDDVKFDLADAYFRKGTYSDALDVAQKVSPAGQQDDAYLALLGDIYAHAGDPARAIAIFQSAIDRNPDNDQYYLSVTLVQLRQGDVNSAEKILQKGLARVPSSGKILWGLGLVSVLRGNTAQAAQRFERAVELLPEWAGSYSTLGAFYYQTGQIDKAREVLDRFKGSKAGGLDVSRIEEVLARAPASATSKEQGSMPMEARQQLLQLALMLADRTL